MGLPSVRLMTASCQDGLLNIFGIWQTCFLFGMIEFVMMNTAETQRRERIHYDLYY
jgi:hypothetical protein